MITLSAGCLPERRSPPSREPVVIASIEPNAGPRTGGNVIRVEGSGFGGRPFVTLGASIVETFVLVTDEAIEFLAPADNVGPASLTVVGEEGGRATLVDAYFYAPLPAVAYERRFFADAPDEAGANPVLVTATGQTIVQLDVDVPRADSGAIEGRLTDDAGAPLAGHDVVAVSLAGAGTVATLTGVDGRYRIEGLVPGAWIVRSDEDAGSPFYDQAWPGVSSTLGADPIDVVAGSAATGIDLALEPGGTIAGTVTGAGPLAGAIVYAEPLDGGSLQFAYALTDAAGGYELAGLAPGSYRLSASAFGSGRVGEYWPGALVPAGATPVAVAAFALVTADFALDEAGAISGEVTESSAALPPLAGTLVTAEELSTGLTYSTATAGDGSWRLGEVAPGDYLVSAPEIGKFFPMSTTTAGATPVTVAAGQEETGINFLGRLGETPCGDPGGTGTVSGAVADAAGSPLPRVDVVLLPTSGGAVSIAITGMDGAWTADCVVPGTYTAHFLPASTDLLSVLGPAGIAVGTGSVGGIDAVLAEGARLSGTVRDAQTFAPLSSVPVRLRNPGTGASHIVLTGADGRWQADRTSLGGIGPGSWIVEVLPHIRSEHSPY